MRKMYYFAALALLFVGVNGLQAQRVHGIRNGQFSPSVTAQPEASTGGGDCDTVAHGFPIPGQQVLYYSQGWGFASGHNDYGDLAFAQRIQNYNGFSQVFGIRFTFGWASSSGPTAKVTARVWPETSGQPGTPLYSQDLTIDSIIAANGNIILNFPSPVAVSGPFYVGFEVTYAPGDTVAVFTTTDSTVSPSTAWSKFSDGSWYPFDNSSSWSLDVAQAIYPIVLEGNFPVTVLPANPTIPSGGQIQLNASGGISYQWYPGTGLSCTNCGNPTASPSVTTTYTVVGWDSTQTCSAITEITVTVTSVGVEDGLFGGQAQVYPNPSTGKVMLRFHQFEVADLQVSVVNALGQTVYSEALEHFHGEYAGAIDLSAFARGLYTLQVTDGQRQFVQKLMVE